MRVYKLYSCSAKETILAVVYCNCWHALSDEVMAGQWALARGLHKLLRFCLGLRNTVTAQQLAFLLAAPTPVQLLFGCPQCPAATAQIICCSDCCLALHDNTWHPVGTTWNKCRLLPRDPSGWLLPCPLGITCLILGSKV